MGIIALCSKKSLAVLLLSQSDVNTPIAKAATTVVGFTTCLEAALVYLMVVK